MIPFLYPASLVYRNGEYVIVNILFVVYPAYALQDSIPPRAEIRSITIKYLTLVSEVSHEVGWKQLGHSLSEMPALEEVVLEFPMDEVQRPFEDVDMIVSQFETRLMYSLRVFVDMELVKELPEFRAEHNPVDHSAFPASTMF